MDLILKQIEHALSVQLHYLAVASCIALPDLCAALESPTGETSKAQYRAWYDAWILPKYPEISSFDMYRLRSGIVHQGVLEPSGMQYTRVIFMIPGFGVVMHRCRLANNGGSSESALTLDATQFCRDIMASVSDWYKATKNDPTVESNLPKLVQFRPNGLAPHIVGVPLIA